MSGPWEKYQKAGPWTKFPAAGDEGYRPGTIQPVDPGLPLIPKVVGGEVDPAYQHEVGKSFEGGVETQKYEPSMVPILDPINAFANSAVEQVPFIGPWLSQVGNVVDSKFASMIEGKEVTPEERRQIDQLEQQQFPAADVAGDVAGSVAPLIPLGMTSIGAKMLGLTGSLPARVGAGAATGALISGGDQLIRSDFDTEEGLKAAGLGALAGGALPIAGDVLGGVGRLLFGNKAPKAPSAAAIKADASASYKAAEESGALIKPEATAILKHDLDTFVTKEGLKLPNGDFAKGFGGVRAALKQLEAFGKSPMSIKQFQRFQEALQDLAGSDKKGVRRIGTMMLKQLDDYIENLPGTAFLGDGADVAANWLAGKAGWAKGSLTGEIEDAAYRAELSPEGFDKGLRDAMRSILIKDRKKPRLPSAVRTAMESFVKGGPVDDFKRSLAGSGGLPGIFVGGMTGGPAGAFLAPLSALGARASLNSGAKKAVDLIRSEAATPGSMRMALDQRRMPYLPPATGGIAVSDEQPGDMLTQIGRMLPAF